MSFLIHNLAFSWKLTPIYKHRSNLNTYRRYGYQLKTSSTGQWIDSTSSDIYADYITDYSNVSVLPSRLNTLISLVKLRGNTLIPPNQRKDLNPFLIPICKLENESKLCYLRWPTQKEDMELQLVCTNPVGVELVSLGTDQYCRRIVAEMDFVSDEKFTDALEILKGSGLDYNRAEYDVFLRSGKFPTFTHNDRRLVLDKYLLMKVGAFPDCYERMANNFLSQGSEVSALITCERAVSVFYGWGHPLAFHAKLLASLPGRNSEASDVARNAMTYPKWTIASCKEDLENVCKLAGFSGVRVVGDMHAFRANDPRLKDIEEGVSPIQVTLDQSAHLMDAVALGSIEGGWESIKEELADKYERGGYPMMKDFILSN